MLGVQNIKVLLPSSHVSLKQERECFSSSFPFLLEDPHGSPEDIPGLPFVPDAQFFTFFMVLNVPMSPLK